MQKEKCFYETFEKYYDMDASEKAFFWNVGVPVSSFVLQYLGFAQC